MAERKPPPRSEVLGLLADHDFLFNAIKARACYLHYNTAKVLQEVIAQTGKMDASALDHVKIECTEMTWAHGYYILAYFFYEKLNTLKGENPEIYKVLSPLFELMCLTIL